MEGNALGKLIDHIYHRIAAQENRTTQNKREYGESSMDSSYSERKIRGTAATRIHDERGFAGYADTRYSDSARALRNLDESIRNAEKQPKERRR